MGKRIKSGVFGLDSLISGGFVHNSVNLVTGEAGAGKTIFSCQFLWEGLQKGEPCLLITLEESPEEIREDAKQFGWNLYQYEKRGLLKIVYHDPLHIGNINPVITNEIKKMKAERVVIDPISVFGIGLDNELQIRKKILSVISAIKAHGCTCIITSEIADNRKLSRFGVEEYLSDSVILLSSLGMDDRYDRSLAIRKMRRTNHSTDAYPFKIGEKGIVVSREA